MPRRDGDYWFDDDAVERVLEFHQRYLPHVKGPLRGKPLKPARWLVDELYKPLFGWKRPHTHAPNVVCDLHVCEYGRRRYTECNLFVPRKNVKTTAISGIGVYCTCADDELGAENYFAAWDLEQAGIDWEIAAAMVENSPEDEDLRDRLLVMRSAYRIVDPETGSFLAAIPATAVDAVGFNVHFGGFDEHWNQVDMKLDRALSTGMGARKQPILIRGSTAGVELASPTGRIWIKIRDFKRGVRRAPEHQLNILYEAPEGADWREVETWKYANPGYGTSLQPMYVRTEISRAIDDPLDRAETLRFGLNIWPEALDAWMPLESWDACGGLVSLDELLGRECIVAIFMPSAVDLAAVALLFPGRAPDEPHQLRLELYFPQKLIALRARQENAPPYQEWADAGVLHLTEGDVLDYETLETKVTRELARTFKVRKVGCNPRGSMQFMQRLIAAQMDVVEIVPSFASMSPALTELMRLVKLGRRALLHDGNAALRWMWTKCKVKTGPNKELRPDPEASLGNIYGVFAVAMALGILVAPADEKPKTQRWRVA
jgi:phage terminase large subunit-like protein